MIYMTAYQLGLIDGANDRESGDYSHNPFILELEYEDYCNWEIGYRDGMGE